MNEITSSKIFEIPLNLHFDYAMNSVGVFRSTRRRSWHSADPACWQIPAPQRLAARPRWACYEARALPPRRARDHWNPRRRSSPACSESSGAIAVESCPDLRRPRQWSRCSCTLPSPRWSQSSEWWWQSRPAWVCRGLSFYPPRRVRLEVAIILKISNFLRVKSLDLPIKMRICFLPNNRLRTLDIVSPIAAPVHLKMWKTLRNVFGAT